MLAAAAWPPYFFKGYSRFFPFPVVLVRTSVYPIPYFLFMGGGLLFLFFPPPPLLLSPRKPFALFFVVHVNSPMAISLMGSPGAPMPPFHCPSTISAHFVIFLVLFYDNPTMFSHSVSCWKDPLPPGGFPRCSIFFVVIFPHWCYVIECNFDFPAPFQMRRTSFLSCCKGVCGSSKSPGTLWSPPIC